jgi:hypothetical protein
MSSREGVRLPEGWLWAIIIDTALHNKAPCMIILMSTREEVIPDSDIFVFLRPC